MNFFVKTAVATTVATLVATAALAETVIIGNDPGPNRGVRSNAVNYLSDQIAERTNGDVRVENNWAGALYSVPTAYDSLATGVADMGLIIGTYAQSEIPELSLGSLVLPKASPWAMMKAMNELMTTNEDIKQRLADGNLVYVTNFALSPALLACRDGEITSLKNVKGVKMSDTGGSSEIFGYLGANLVKMPVYEVYQSMETGLIDCTVTYPYYAVATKLSDLVTTVTPLGFSPVVTLGSFMNKDSFDALSEENQAVILQVGQDMIDYYGEKLEAADAAAMDGMATREDPVKFFEFSEDEREVMLNEYKPVLQDWKDDANASGLDADGVYDEFVALIKNWDDVGQKDGLPWKRN